VLSEPGSNSQTIVYLNRLSDLLFVLARVANNQGRSDVLWTPGRFGHDQKTVTES
jgi:cob(I)alamin adenosyltransferase